ncbi:MAG: FAD-dependent oxidoreductase, partial [Salinisphaera sp.]|nr:FAD-dependent oxidoreductase [Salinisphaera sp.]
VVHEGRPVDTGFIVLNDRNYARFQAFLAALGVPTQASSMSFGVSIGDGAIEWAGDNLATMFAQRKLAASAAHWRMLVDILRFNRQAKALLVAGVASRESLGAFLDHHQYSEAFRARYLLPMAAAIWSVPTRIMLDFPLAPFLHFLNNHGLLNLSDRPQWRTITGGCDRYVQAVVGLLGDRLRLGCPVARAQRTADAVKLRLASGESADFDQVVFACHADTALSLLADPDAREKNLLGAFRFQRNRAVLHSDPKLMPKRRSLWSSWNYLADRAEVSAQRVSVSYWMNRLQGIDGPRDYFVSLNPLADPDPRQLIREIDYDHPVFDARAIDAQAALGSIQGSRRSWFCGAWCGYGFHEDGLAAAERVAKGLGVTAPWSAGSG